MRNGIKFFLLIWSLSVYAQLNTSKLPPSGGIKKITLADAQTFKLKNGLQILYIQDTLSGLSQFTLYKKQAPAPEGDKVGVSSLMTSLLGQGTVNIEREKFLRTIEEQAADLYFSKQSASLVCLPHQVQKLFPLYAEAIQKPLWSTQLLERERDRMIESLKATENDASAIAEKVKAKLVYGSNHPYGEVFTEKTIQKITIEDIAKLYNQNFNPTNSFLLVSGNFSEKELKRLVKKYFGKWRASDSIPTDSLPISTKPEKSYIALVDVPTAVQSQVAISYPVSICMNDPDYFALEVANIILGGNFNSRLNMNLREKNGYTYGARGMLMPDLYQGSFIASTKVRNEVTDSALIEMIKEIEGMKTKPVTDEELQLAKAALKGSYIRKFEDPTFPLSTRIKTIIEELPDDFYEKYLLEIEKITKEDIQKVAEKYFTTQQAIFIVVGNAKDIMPKLEKLPYPIKTLNRYGDATMAK